MGGLSCQLLNTLENSWMPWGSEVTYIKNYLPPSHLPKEIWEPTRETFEIMNSHWLCGQRSSVCGWRGVRLFFGMDTDKEAYEWEPGIGTGRQPNITRTWSGCGEVIEAFHQTPGLSFYCPPLWLESDFSVGFLVGKYGSVCDRSVTMVKAMIVTIIFAMRYARNSMFWIYSFIITNSSPWTSFQSCGTRCILGVRALPLTRQAISWKG